TEPDEYRFLDFYQYRSRQIDLLSPFKRRLTYFGFPDEIWEVSSSPEKDKTHTTTLGIYLMLIFWSCPLWSVTDSMEDFQESREGKHRLHQDVNNFWNEIEIMCYKNEQKRLESERATRTTQNMMENLGEETVEEAENARKRSCSEFTEYEQMIKIISIIDTTEFKLSVQRKWNKLITIRHSRRRIPLYSLTNAFSETSSQQSDTNIGNSTIILPGEKLMFNGVSIGSAYSDMKKMKKTEVAKTNQLRDKNSEAINFAFYEVDDLKTLGECLVENQINISTASNDLIYVQNLFYHFFFLYKNDFLTQNMYKAYGKLKELLEIGGRSAPKLDGKDLIKYLGTEILAQEDGVRNTRSKRKGDLQKLEYCSKVILTTQFFTLPSTAKGRITNIETYSLQSNGFRLTVSVSKYLFEDTVIMMDVQDVEIPRTVDGFSNLVMAVKVILSWKARTRRNTMAFYEALKKGRKRITNGVHYSTKRYLQCGIKILHHGLDALLYNLLTINQMDGRDFLVSVFEQTHKSNKSISRPHTPTTSDIGSLINSPETSPVGSPVVEPINSLAIPPVE
ncbi:16788_t:CDS:10, partial [Funneliformis geosporum]